MSFSFRRMCIAILTLLISSATLTAQSDDGPRMIFGDDTVNCSFFVTHNQSLSNIYYSKLNSASILKSYAIGARFRNIDIQLSLGTCEVEGEHDGSWLTRGDQNYMGMFQASAGYAFNIYDVVELVPRLGYMQYHLSFITDQPSSYRLSEKGISYGLELHTSIHEHVGLMCSFTGARGFDQYSDSDNYLEIFSVGIRIGRIN